jgi:hypothetical protein
MIQLKSSWNVIFLHFFLGAGACTVSWAQPAFLESSGQVVIEAENFTASAAGTGTAASKTWNSNSTSGASGTARQALANSGVSTADSLNGPRLDYRVKFVTPGTYYFWIRLRGGAAADNAIHAGLNGAAAPWVALVCQQVPAIILGFGKRLKKTTPP